MTGRHKAVLVMLCCVGQFLLILSVSVMQSAAPLIRADLGFSPAGLQWVVNAYQVLFAGFVLLGGRAADLMSQRAVFIGGFALFSGASLVGGLATHPVMLAVARGVQGLGAAVLAPATLSILTGTFTDNRERARALAVWGAVSGSGGSMGLLVGGVLTDLLHWRWALLINVPIGAVAMIVAYAVIRPVRHVRRTGTMDVAGAFTLSAGMIGVVYAIVSTTEYGWGSPHVVAPAVGGLVLLAVFAVVELHIARVPLIPLRALARRRLATANLVVFLYGFAIVAAWYFVALYLEQNLGYDPFQIGIAFVPMAVIIIGCALASGTLTVRFGTGRVLTAGMGLIAVALVLFAVMPVRGSYLGNVLAPIVVTAVGVGVSFVASVSAATDQSATRDAGFAAGLMNTSRQIGGALGLALLATVAAAREHALTGRVSAIAATTSGYRYAFVASAVVAILATLLAATLIRPPFTAREPEPSATLRPLDRTRIRRASRNRP